jgi:sugar diacid utilization regulator/predicted hydrocarbon binding protein
MKISDKKDKLNLPSAGLDLQGNKNQQMDYEIDFLEEEGAIKLLGTRRLMFSAEAFGSLRKELIDSLGLEIARQILFRFGYQCGVKDSLPIKKIISSKDKGVLMGPFFHRVQGIVLAKNQELLFSEEGELQLMKGNWYNSYEADQHVRLYGLAQDSVCWSLAGYATGYASEILEEELLCIETECAARGFEACVYEIRSVNQWPPEVSGPWLFDHQPVSVEKNLAVLLAEERLRNYRQQLFHDCLGQVMEQADSEMLLRKLIYYSHRLAKASGTALFTVQQSKDKLAFKDFVGDENIINQLTSSQQLADKAYYYGETFVHYELDQTMDSRYLLAIPVLTDKEITNVVVMVTDNKTDLETIESIKLLIQFSGVQLEKINSKEEIAALHLAGSRLQSEQASLQQHTDELSFIIDTTKEFLNFILKGRGIMELVQEMGEQTQAHVVLLNVNQEIFGRNLEKSRAEELVYRLKKQQGKGLERNLTFPLLAGERKLGEMLAVERHARFSRKEELLLEAGAKIIALEVLKEQEAQLQYRFNFFESLLSGDYTSIEVLVTQANKVNFLLDGTYQIIGITLEGLEPDANTGNQVGSLYEALYHKVRECVKSRSPKSKALIFSNQIIIFLSYADQNWTKTELEQFFSQMVNHIKKYFPKYGAYLVAGRICNSLDNYPLAYKEIKSCLSIMSRLKQRDRVFYFEKMGVLAILFEVEQSKLVDFVNSVLGPLVDYDEGTGLELLPTLSLYVQNNFNIQVTARNHFISASTLKYRLRKIRDLGIDLEDSEVRLNIQLALKITEYSN